MPAAIPPDPMLHAAVLNRLEGGNLPVYGDGFNVRDWHYVDDHARALLMIATKGRVGETYAIGGRNEQTNLNVVNRICDLLNQMSPAGASRRALIEHVPDRPGHDRRYAIDATKLERELGWRRGDVRKRRRTHLTMVSRQ
jgi:dTDP-glucose 4,6-dehydratase